MDSHPGRDGFFDFVERPFSLTPDPKYYFRSRSHGQVFDALSTGVANRESLLLVAGDLGVGKTTLCKTFVSLLQRRTRAVLVGNALLSPEDLLRLLLQDVGAVAKDEVRRGRLAGASRAELHRMLDEFLIQLRSTKDGAVVIIDEAQSLPPATVDEVVALASIESENENVLQILLAAQRPPAAGPALPRVLDDRIGTRARLLPLDRDECERYVAHRLTIAGGSLVAFSPGAIDVIHGLSGGTPRLVNLLCERALEVAATAQSHRVGAEMIESAASGLEMLRLRSKRFRWFGTHGR